MSERMLPLYVVIPVLMEYSRSPVRSSSLVFSSILGPRTSILYYIRFLTASATGLVKSATSTAYIAKLPTASLR